MTKKLMILAAVLCCAMTIWAQGPLQKSKMSPWLLNKYQQQQTAVKENGGPLKVKGRTVRNYILTLVQSTDEADAVRAKGGVVLQDFGNGICAAFLPTDSLGGLNESPDILCMEANEPSQQENDTSAVIMGVTKAWDFENALNSQLSARPKGALSSERTFNSQLVPAFTGKGVYAAIMDRGFDFTHPAFRNDDGTSRIQWFWDPLAENDNPDELGQTYTTPEQVLAAKYCTNATTNNHGTHVLGSMAGDGLNGRYVGMAPEADIIGAFIPLSEKTDDVMDAFGKYVQRHIGGDLNISDVILQIAPSDVVELVELAKIFAQADAAGKPCVVNWSFGANASFYADWTLYEQVFNQLVGPGHIVVSSAGNEGDYNCYLKKEAGTPLEQDIYYSSTEGWCILYMRTEPDEPFFNFSLKFDGIDQQFSINTEDVYNAYLKGGLIGVKRDDLYMDITIKDGAFGKRVYEIYVEPRGDFAESLYSGKKMKLHGKIQIGSDPQVELRGKIVDYNQILFSDKGYYNSRGCNPGTIAFPGDLARIITVGGMHHRSTFKNISRKQNTCFTLGSQEGQLMSFSSCGPTMDGRVKPDVVAPGHNIISALNSFYSVGSKVETDAELKPEIAYRATELGKSYSMLAKSGTSMAAPMASGVIALWLQAKPDLTPEDILGVIARTSHQPEPEFSGYEKNNYYGYGEIDAYAGLLDILKLTDIPELSHHQPAGLTFRVEGHTLYIDGLDGEAPITLFDLSGRPVLQTVTSGTLQLPNLAAGVYAVQLSQLGSTLIRL